MTPKQRAQALKRAERDKRVLALIRQGATLSQIVEAEGLYDTSHASKVVRLAIERAGPPEVDKKFARARHRDRLDALWRAAYPRAVGGKSANSSVEIPPDIKWVEQARKILVDIAEFEGTNAPKEVRVGGSKNAPPVQMAVVEYGDLAEMSDEQLSEARRSLEEATRNVTAAAAALGGGPGAGEAPSEEDL